MGTTETSVNLPALIIPLPLLVKALSQIISEYFFVFKVFSAWNEP